MSETRVAVVGAGLAGCEAAYQLAERGITVELYEMKPGKMSPAHHSGGFCELVCSNSLRSDRMENAVGLLKAELRILDPSCSAWRTKHAFPPAARSRSTGKDFPRGSRDRPNASEHRRTQRRGSPRAGKPRDRCDGPLTSDALAEDIARMTGEALHFYDAAAPIVRCESLDMTKVYRASRYGRGDDYLNCPMTREEYERFYQALVTAETAELHAFETPRVFEGCMPVEVMAKRGEQTLCFGPLKPVGLEIDGRNTTPSCSCGRTTRMAGCITSWGSRPISSLPNSGACSD